MTTDNQTTLAELLKVDEMPVEHREALLERVGNIIIEASVGQLLMNLGEAQASKLEEYLKTVSAEDDVFAYLLRTYPDFQSIVEKEIASLHQEATKIFGE